MILPLPLLIICGNRFAPERTDGRLLERDKINPRAEIRFARYTGEYFGAYRVFRCGL